jgi:hypothetical protein
LFGAGDDVKSQFFAPKSRAQRSCSISEFLSIGGGVCILLNYSFRDSIGKICEKIMFFKEITDKGQGIGHYLRISIWEKV